MQERVAARRGGCRRATAARTRAAELGFDDVDSPGVDRVENVTPEVETRDASTVGGEHRGRQPDVPEAEDTHVVLGTFRCGGLGRRHVHGMLSRCRDVVHPARILVVFGTRPEVIKLAPAVQACRAGYGEDWTVAVCNTGQHRELVPPLLATFGLTPEAELVMNPGQSLSMLTARLLDGLTRC